MVRLLTGQKLIFFFFKKLPDQLLRTPSLQFHVFKALFPQDQSGRVVNLTTHLYLSTRTLIMNTATNLLHHTLHGLDRDAFNFTILCSETKICPIVSFGLWHSNIYIQLTEQEPRMYVSVTEIKRMLNSMWLGHYSHTCCSSGRSN